MVRIVLAILLFGGSCLPVSGQIKNIRIDIGRVEPAIGISRKNPDNIVVAVTSGNYYFSQDGGQTWKKSETTREIGEATNPAILSDRKGTFYTFFVSAVNEGKERIVCSESKDGGVTWQEHSHIELPAEKKVKQPSVSLNFKSGEMLMTWTQFDKYGSNDPGHKSSVMLSRSKDGKKWSTPMQLSQLQGSCLDDNSTPRGATPVMTIDGKMFAGWAMGQKIYLDRSFDKGNTWLNNDITVGDQPGGWTMGIPGLKSGGGLPIFGIDNSPGRYNGSIFLTWADTRKGESDADVWFLRSVNFGDNWTTPLRINDDGPGKHQFMPAMTVDQSNGNIYIVYYDRRAHDDEATDVYLAFSTDNGNSFKNIKISETPFIPTNEVPLGDYIHVDAYRGLILVAWTRMDEEETSVWVAPLKHDDIVKAAQVVN